MSPADVPAVPPDDLRLPPRRTEAHKGDHGRVLVFAGSWGMHGAAALCAAAAFRSGAGLVRVALPAPIYPVVGAAELRATYLPLPEREPGVLADEAEGLLLAAIAESDAVAVGPGLGAHPSTRALLQRIVPAIDRPLVLDADGLNAFAGEPARIAGPRPCTFVTPHPGELARLTGQRCAEDDESRRIAAIDLAMRVGGTVILKGHRSVVTDGIDVHFNTTGNPGMATGGSGDVLTGCLAALCCVLPEPLHAARIAAWAHGDAGDRAARRLTETGLTATDLLDDLALSIQEFLGSSEDT